jgi:hypothetical protein
MTDAATWFAARTAGAPPELRASAAAFLARATSGGCVASQLGEAATLALRAVLGQEKSRATALALLTADSLVTLALLAQVEAAPADLERFAAGIVGAEAA